MVLSKSLKHGIQTTVLSYITNGYFSLDKATQTVARLSNGTH